MFASSTSSSNTSSHIASWQVLRFSHWCIWEFWSSDMWHCITEQVLQVCLQDLLYQQCVTSRTPDTKQSVYVHHDSVACSTVRLYQWNSQSSILTFQITQHELIFSNAVNTVSKFYTCMFTYCLQRQGSPQSVVMNPSMPASVYCTVVMSPRTKLWVHFRILQI